MTGRRRTRPGLLAAVAAATVALGCVSVSTDPGGGTGGADRPRAPAPSGQGPDGTDTPEEFAADVDAAKAVAERYWAARVRGFEPVAELIPYEREGEVDCGGQPLGLRNAAYCSAGDFIAYDVNWAFQAFRQIGDAFIFYLLGHEYAHAVQLRLGIRKQYTIQQELQADCMAGAYIGDMERQGDLTLDEGDTEELARGLDAVGDQPGQPWFAEGSHGTSQQRTRAFVNGYEDSLEPCELS